MKRITGIEPIKYNYTNDINQNSGIPKSVLWKIASYTFYNYYMLTD
jgi:hypothetical protein